VGLVSNIKRGQSCSVERALLRRRGRKHNDVHLCCPLLQDRFRKEAVHGGGHSRYLPLMAKKDSLLHQNCANRLWLLDFKKWQICYPPPNQSDYERNRIQCGQGQKQYQPPKNRKGNDQGQIRIRSLYQHAHREEMLDRICASVHKQLVIGHSFSPG